MEAYIMTKKESGVAAVNKSREKLNCNFNLSPDCNTCYNMRLNGKTWFCNHEDGSNCFHAPKLRIAYRGKFIPPKVKPEPMDRFTLLGDNNAYKA